MVKNNKTVKLYTGDVVAATFSKGNQEKWYEDSNDCWYKFDRIGFEALAEAVAGEVLRKYSNIEEELGYRMFHTILMQLNRLAGWILLESIHRRISEVVSTIFSAFGKGKNYRCCNVTKKEAFLNIAFILMAGKLPVYRSQQSVIAGTLKGDICRVS